MEKLNFVKFRLKGSKCELILNELRLSDGPTIEIKMGFFVCS